LLLLKSLTLQLHTAKLDTAAVTAVKITQSTITQAKLASNSVGATQIIQSTITQAKLAANSVGSNQLISTTVTPATYTSATITVDADGRITAASSGSAGAGMGIPTLYQTGPSSGTHTAAANANRLGVIFMLVVEEVEVENIIWKAVESVVALVDKVDLDFTIFQ
jgi:hypothetical protein